MKNSDQILNATHGFVVFDADSRTYLTDYGWSKTLDRVKIYRQIQFAQVVLDTNPRKKLKILPISIIVHNPK